MRRRLQPLLLFSLLSAPVLAADAPPPAAQPAPPPAAAPGAAAQPAGAGTEAVKPAAGPTIAPDTAREKAIADALLPRVRPDQAVWLDADGAKVLALYDVDTKGKPRGTAVILHGIESSPDVNGVIHALRTRLPDRGWSTLAVQLPILPAGSPPAAYAGTLAAAKKRLQAAMAYLKTKQAGPIVLVGYEFGAVLALRGAGEPGVAAVVALDLPGSEVVVPPAEVNTMLEKLRTPVLDLYGSVDSTARLDLAPPRAASARKAGNAGFRQEPLAGADDRFTGTAPLVVRRVSAWLDKVITAQPASPP